MKLTVNKQDIKEITKLKGFHLLSHQRRKKKIVKLVQETILPGSDVLDVGCASGDIAVELSYRGYRLHGLDFEALRLNAAKKLALKYGQDIIFENKSLNDIDKSRTYSLILLGEVIEHFSDPVRVLREIKSLLKSSGKVLITTPNMPSLRNRLKFSLFGVFPDNNPEHLYYFDCRRFFQVVTNAGYRVTYFRTGYTNLLRKSVTVSLIEDILLFWFALFFKNSGDTIFSIICPDPASHQKI